MKTTRQTIHQGWQVQAVEPTDLDPTLRLPAIPAEVPGHVHLDLERAGVIPDPFYRLHERDVAWVDDADWVYSTSFSLDAVPNDDTFLVFHGLDTIADITLNDRPVGSADNMFIPHEFDVSHALRRGDNTLTVRFHSARRVGAERHAAWSTGHDTMPYDPFFWGARSFVRKAQYMYGWDWGPVLISCGIWRPVELLTVPVVRFVDWSYSVTLDGDEAIVRFTATVQRAGARSPASEIAPLVLHAAIEGVGEAHAAVPTASSSSIAVAIPIPEPRRWSPETPHLYPVSLRLSTAETVVDEIRSRIGLRTIELVREPDADQSGESFLFRVNGQNVFCRGANWIPADSFPSRSYDNPDRLRPLLTAAKEAGFNMLRVWGGGMYESDTFYDLCDELGILVWQDFPYACAYYPDDPPALERAAREAATAVRRLRVHPSLALWCGNNENQQMYADDWHELNPPRLLGQPLYDTVLPRVVAEHDPATPYWPGSPFGGPHPNSEDVGDRHNWNVWHGSSVEAGDWPHYADDGARFCSEFGFASSCGAAAWDSCLTVNDWRPRSVAVRWHDKTRKGYDTYLAYVERHFPPIESLDDLIYYSQLNQAEAMKLGVEHYRRSKGRCWGTLIWQLNDCWPVQSWSMIDYLGEPKAVYYAARRFYAPLLLSLVRVDNLVEAHLVNDLVTPLTGTLTLRFIRFDGTIVRETTETVSIAANGAVLALRDCIPADVDSTDTFVHGTLLDAARHPIAENILLLAEPKELRLPPEQPVLTFGEADGHPTITLESPSFAAYVWLTAPALGPCHWSDNTFHLLPHRPHTVSLLWPSGITADSFQKHLRLRTLRG